MNSFTCSKGWLIPNPRCLYGLDRLDTTQFCKDVYIELMDTVCINCGAEPTLINVSMPPSGNGSYRTTVTRLNLEAHHVKPIFRKRHRYRLGELECPLGCEKNQRQYLEKFSEEMSKCVLLCLSCHRKVTTGKIKLPNHVKAVSLRCEHR